MTIFRYSLAILAVAAPVLAETVVTPGGLTLDMYAVIVEPDTGMARFRFMTPDLATIGADAAYPDMQWLCDTVALPEVQAMGAATSQIIITLSDRAVPQGQTDPGAVQYFEGYAIGSGTCVWEPY